MPTAPRVLLLAPFLSACVEIKIDFPCAGEGCPETGDETAGSGPTADSGEPTGDTSGPVEDPYECGDDLPSEVSLPTDAACGVSPVEDWELVKVWSAGSSGINVATARAQDVDGDGAITAADPMQIWVTTQTSIDLFDADGTPLGVAAQGDSQVYADIAEVDSSAEGVEILASWYRHPAAAGVALVNGTSGVWYSSLPTGRLNRPLLADLEPDGAIEALLGGWIVDASTGAELGWLEGMDSIDLDDTNPSIAADLDLDGSREIVAAPEIDAAVYLFDSDGGLRATCLESPGSSEGWDPLSYGVANLDDDPEGEVFVAGYQFNAICDANGTLLASATTEEEQVSLVGIGQLDEDDEPELLVARWLGLVALELDLTEKWRVAEAGVAWYPFALADLDGDGRHEVLYNTHGQLVIVGPDGEELARATIGALTGSAWQNQPIVADIDADGLVEIVATGGGAVELFENASGGWPVREAATPWHGLNRAPHDRDVAGAIPAPAATWLEEGYNVWQGLPAGTPGRPDLAVSFVEVCVSSCDEDVTVVIQAGNTGTTPLFGGAELVLYATDGAELGRTTLSGTLSPGEGRYASFTVPASALDGGLRAEVTATDATDECGRADNTAVWTEDLCP